jgi:AmmeMemoRadiSam system protein A
LDETTTIRPVAPTAGDQLIDLADDVIVTGLDRRRAPAPDISALHPDLHQRLGAFVTLTVRGDLNGCIGSIEGEETLGAAVARHAWSAAFADPRLPPLRRSDYPQLEIEVSVLSPLSPLPAQSLDALLGVLRPGIDGLLIGAGTRRAVFLPSVWEQLPSADRFVEHLFRKAGLAPDVWPRDLRAHRFSAQKIRRAHPGSEMG